MTNDTQQTIFHAAKRFFSGTMVSRVTGLMRDVAMAFAFGTEASAAALMVAFRFSHFFRRLLGEGALQTAFIPKFESYREENNHRALSFFCSLTGLLSLILFFIVTVTMTGLSLTYLYGNLSNDNNEIIFLTLLMMPSLLFICLYGLNTGLLQCEKVYFIPSAAPAAFNMLWVAGAIGFRHSIPSDAMPWLAGAIVLGCAAQWLITIPPLWKILKNYHYTLSYREIFLFSTDLKKFLAPLFLSMIGVASSQINNTLDPLFARYADSEGPAFLWYAIRLEQLPLALFGIALSGALLPPLSRAIQAKDVSRYKNFLNSSIRYSLLCMVPMAFALTVSGDTCINLLFGHGDFGIESTIATTRCLWGYALGLIPSALVLIIAPGFYSLEDFRTPTLTTSFCVVLNIILNTVFIHYLSLGAASIALATSISTWMNFAILFWALTKKVGPFFYKETVISFTTTVVICCIASSAVLFTDYFLYEGSSALTILYGGAPQLPRSFYEQLARFIQQALVFGTPVIAYWRYALSFRSVLVNKL